MSARALKDFADRNGLSATELAAVMGIAPTTCYELLSGRRKVQVYHMRLVEALRVVREHRPDVLEQWAREARH